MNRWRYLLHHYLGWFLIAGLCMIPVLRWIQLVDASTEVSSWYGIASTIGKLSALVGTILYAINFVQATRAKWLESVFGGLNRVYIAHHVSGGVALILLCLHPLFLALRAIEPQLRESYAVAAQSLLPDAIQYDSFALFTESMAVNFGRIGFFGLVILMVVTFFVKLPYRTWLLTHKFLGVAFLFAGLHIVYVWSDVRNDLPLRLYLIIWIGIGLAAFVHRSLLSRIFVRQYEYVVDQISNPTDGVISFTMRGNQKLLSFREGQFVFIRFKNGPLKGEAHPFSLTSRPKDKNESIQIIVKALGDFTSAIQNAKIGDDVSVEGAYGRFTPARYNTKKQVWIAGGIGVTPFISMIRTLDARDHDKVDMFYSVNNSSELISRQEFVDLSNSTSTFRFHEFVAGGQNGFLTVDYIEKVVGDLTDVVFFMCGPPAMMKALRRQLRDRGVKKRMIMSEEFSII